MRMPLPTYWSACYVVLQLGDLPITPPAEEGGLVNATGTALLIGRNTLTVRFVPNEGNLIELKAVEELEILPGDEMVFRGIPEDHVGGGGTEVIEENGEGFEKLQKSVEAVIVASRIDTRGVGVDTVGEVTMDEVELWAGIGLSPNGEVGIED